MRRSVSASKRTVADSGTYSTFAVSPSTAAATALQKSTSKPCQAPDPSFSEKPASPSLTPQINFSLERTSSSVPAVALSVTTKVPIKDAATAQLKRKLSVICVRRLRLTPPWNLGGANLPGRAGEDACPHQAARFGGRGGPPALRGRKELNSRLGATPAVSRLTGAPLRPRAPAVSPPASRRSPRSACTGARFSGPMPKSSPRPPPTTPPVPAPFPVPAAIRWTAPWRGPRASSWPGPPPRWWAPAPATTAPPSYARCTCSRAWTSSTAAAPRPASGCCGGWLTRGAPSTSGRGPNPGDLVFFDDTHDRNHDGRRNDPLTHVGIVVRTESDGTVVFAHRLDRGVVLGRMNLSDPGVRTVGGRVVNDWLREGGAVRGSAARSSPASPPWPESRIRSRKPARAAKASRSSWRRRALPRPRPCRRRPSSGRARRHPARPAARRRGAAWPRRCRARP